jgi:hypothetical protein
MYAILVWASLIPLVDVDMMSTDESHEEQIQTYRAVNRMDEEAIKHRLSLHKPNDNRLHPASVRKKRQSLEYGTNPHRVIKPPVTGVQ